MWPASSVSGIYIAHPDAYYFGVAKAVCDQVHDYSIRKGMDFSEARRWLAPILNYIPVPPSKTAAGCGLRNILGREQNSFMRKCTTPMIYIIHPLPQKLHHRLIVRCDR